MARQRPKSGLIPKFDELAQLYNYGNCSKILNTRGLPIRPEQTRQTQLSLLMKKQSDQGPLCLLCYSDKHFVNTIPDIKLTFYLRTEKEVFGILEHLPYFKPKYHFKKTGEPK